MEGRAPGPLGPSSPRPEPSSATFQQGPVLDQVVGEGISRDGIVGGTLAADRDAHGGPLGGAEASVPASPPSERVLNGSDELVDGRELRVFQVHNAYLVVEEEDGLTVIDQHALHEKILFEELCESRQRGELRQPLLMPETVQLSADEWENWERCSETLNELGFEVEEFGDRTIIVRAVPAGYEKLATGPFVKDVMARWLEARRHGGDSPVELRQHLVATLACKAAVKAGQRLSPQQQLDLVRGRSRAFQPQNCPHGRPSELFLSWQELERRFDRK